MAGTALPGRLNWKPAEILDVITETPRTKTIAFHVPEWPGHKAGQHVDVRLTSNDGYQAERSYSIASAPRKDHLYLFAMLPTAMKPLLAFLFAKPAPA